jgi:hypothetical protein
MSRQKRTQRAFTLVLVTGGGAVATLVSLIVGASFGFVLLLAVITAVAGYMLRRTLGR